MIHISIIALVFALVAGAVAITLSALSYRQSRSPHVIPHIHLISSVNGIVLVNMATLYFYQNLSSEASVAAVWAVDSLHQILVPPLQILAVCSLVHLAFLLAGGSRPRFRVRRCASAAGGLGALQAVFALGHFTVADLPVLFLVYRLVEGLALVAAYGTIGVLVVKAGHARPVARRKSVRTYAVMLAAILTLTILANLLSWLNRIPPATYAVVLAALVLTANLVPVLYYQRFLLPRFNSYNLPLRAESPPVSLGEMFDISAREREVLHLVCRGHTNQEIADLLFISLQTVKDHVSRIYRKVGVKSRIQLMAMISDRSDPPHPGDARGR